MVELVLRLILNTKQHKIELIKMATTLIASEKVWNVLLHLQLERDLSRYYAFFLPFFRIPVLRNKWIAGLPIALVYYIGGYLLPDERTLDRHSMYLLIDIANKGLIWKLRSVTNRQQHYKFILGDKPKFTRKMFTQLVNMYPKAVFDVMVYFKLHRPINQIFIDSALVKIVHRKQHLKCPTITWFPHCRRSAFPSVAKSWWEICKGYLM